MRRSFRTLALAALLWSPACGSDGGGDDGGADVDWSGGDTGGGGGGGDSAEPDPGVPVDVEFTEIGFSGGTIYLERFKPEGCTPETPCAAVVLVPDGMMGGDEFFGDDGPRKLASQTGAMVVRYNPPSRGTGSRISGGVEDYGGIDGQDALRDVINATIKDQDTSDVIGVVSFGFGLTTASGALARHQPTTLKEVDFLIDVEGPVNRCYITARAFDEGAGITTDGSGANTQRCDYDLADREVAFPIDPPEGVPPALVCNDKVFPIAQTGKDCNDDTWWKDREPKLHLKNLRGAYLRLQMEYDHAQPSRWSALLATHFAIQSSKLTYKQLNNVESNTALLQVGDDQCAELGCYLSPSAGNSYLSPSCDNFGCTAPDNAFSNAFDGYDPMSLETFLVSVLPKYVTRMVELD
jgi:hypothetical protein